MSAGNVQTPHSSSQQPQLSTLHSLTSLVRSPGKEMRFWCFWLWLPQTVWISQSNEAAAQKMRSVAHIQVVFILGSAHTHKLLMVGRCQKQKEGSKVLSHLRVDW